MVAMRSKLIRQALVCACLLFFLVSSLHSDTRPLPEDLGALHLAQLLAKLKTTARIMQVVAHPDDEDGGLLTLESRGKGVSVVLFTVTRGEGGQNKFGAESSDELRTRPFCFSVRLRSSLVFSSIADVRMRRLVC